MRKNIIAVIGDIHGCFTTLVELYEKVISVCSAVYTTGDIIDRGRDSRKVIDFCITHGIKPVKGNHEYELLDILQRYIENKRYGFVSKLLTWEYMGGINTIKNYDPSYNRTSLDLFIKDFENSGHYNFIKNLPMNTIINNVIISHSGIIKGLGEYEMLYNRDVPDILPQFQVFGHTPVRKPEYVEGHYINIDTGCIFNNQLSCAVIDSERGIVTETLSVPVNKYDKYWIK